MKILTKLPAFMALIIATGGCSKNTMTTKPVVIIKHSTGYLVKPAAAIFYSAVTISGSGFDTVKADNIVKFNGTRGLINSITPKQIIVTIPAAATSGKLTLTTKGKTVDILDTFKVFHMVQAEHIAFPVNTPDSISSLAFDKNGNMYGIGGGHGLLKFANGALTGALSTIYAPPNSKDTVDYNSCYFVNFPSGSQKVCPGILYSFYIGGTLTDSQGNIYVVRDSSVTPYDVADGVLKKSNKAVKTSNKAAINSTFGDNLSILKISPAGNVATLTKIPPGGRMPSTAIDPAGNIYFMENPDTTIYKVTPEGTISVFAVVHHQFTSCICADSEGNIYVACKDAAPDFTGIVTILKYTPQGNSSILTGPTNYGFDNFLSMSFDPYGNLLAAGEPDLLLINSAGYITRLPGNNTDYIYIDYAGNLYEESEFEIVKYLVK